MYSSIHIFDPDWTCHVFRRLLLLYCHPRSHVHRFVVMRLGPRTDRGPSASQVSAARPHKPRLDRDRAEPHRLRNAVRRRRGAQGGTSHPTSTALRSMWTQRPRYSCVAFTELTHISAARGLGRGRLRRLGVVCGRSRTSWERAACSLHSHDCDRSSCTHISRSSSAPIASIFAAQTDVILACRTYRCIISSPSPFPRASIHTVAVIPGLEHLHGRNQKFQKTFLCLKTPPLTKEISVR